MIFMRLCLMRKRQSLQRPRLTHLLKNGLALTGKIFFKEIGHEDYVCWLSILKQGYKAQNTNTVTALYRVSDHSVSSNKLKAMRWQWNIVRNEMDLPVYKAVYYFIHYAIRAFAKAMR